MIDQIRVAATRRISTCIVGAVVSLSGPAIGSAAGDAALRTTAESTGFETTGRYTEVDELCHSYARAFPRQVRCFAFGITPEGRTMWALAASTDSTLQPAATRARKRPVFLFQGGIHAGEIDGKDAGFIALRSWLDSKAGNDLLRAVTVVFVPVFNVDGHERFGAWNRPNQVGPREMGWRTTAQNLNLNRD
jgi:murein tripeptide amidase MpaA